MNSWPHEITRNDEAFRVFMPAHKSRYREIMLNNFKTNAAYQDHGGGTVCTDRESCGRCVMAIFSISPAQGGHHHGGGGAQSATAAAAAPVATTSSSSTNAVDVSA